jgi:hypothetical protein
VYPYIASNSSSLFKSQGKALQLLKLNFFLMTALYILLDTAIAVDTILTFGYSQKSTE